MAKEHSRPNVLLIMSDEHHPRFMGCAGERLVRTPVLDALAARGVRFSGAYCGSPLCGPSRMSFMSARLPSRTGCIDNLSQLPPDVPTFAHGFLTAGYETIISGRMHFVGQDQRHGFVERTVSDVTTAYIPIGWKLGPILGDLVDTPGYYRNGLIKSGPGRTGYHAYDEAVAKATAEWLEARGRRVRGAGASGAPDSGASASGGETQPFMMVVGFASPHCPFIAPPEDYAIYDGKITEADLPDPRLDLLHPGLWPQRRGARLDEPEPVTPAAQRRARQAYYGLCTFLDRQIGRVLEALERSGLAEETIVVYTSDHGEQLGEHGLWWKTTFYEASVGVPLLVAGPRGGGWMAGGRVVGENVNLMDVGPTLLDLVGAVPGAGAGAGAGALPDVDGRSFKCLIDGEPGKWEDETVSECFSAFMEPPAMRMVKRGPWKFVYYHGLAPQLFNVAEDPGEFNDRSADPACREVVARMRARALRDWDPAAVEHRLAMRKLEVPLIRKWMESMKLAEPDPMWFDGPLENWVRME